MKKIIYTFSFLCILLAAAHAQVAVDMKGFSKKNGAAATLKGSKLQVSWPAGGGESGQILLNLEKEKPLFASIGVGSRGTYKEIAAALDPSFILTVGKRDLVSQNGWNIFFDKVPQKPHRSYPVQFTKGAASVQSQGSRTIIRIGEVSAENFRGALEITCYNGSLLFNIAAVMSTPVDSVAMVYDAGLLSKSSLWKQVAWSDTDNKLQNDAATQTDTARNLAVKYRTIIGETAAGSLAVFPAPHQYFYPLDEAFNLKFTWYGANYRNMLSDFGIGIRQELEGDKRYVPWFNAPPGTRQRLNFFCLISGGNAGNALAEVKRFTHNDTYLPLPGYKTMASHFHNEYVMKVVLANQPPATGNAGQAAAGDKPLTASSTEAGKVPNFVNVFKTSGVNIVHLAEFHYTAHPKGPDDQRLLELKTLFDQCKKFSDNRFLLLPGEEPNEFFGGHWLDFFPRPVYWIMSRKPEAPFVTDDNTYGKVYRINDKNDMLKLLEQEQGLAWTAHPRTKGSTGFPDKYKEEGFFKSDRFLGAAWKAMPADLSQPRLGKRVFDLMDDMNNWGLKKSILSEADLFTIEPENEMYAHMNINYLQLDHLPAYDSSWQPILDVLSQGRFFSTTGEVLIPLFNVNGKGSGETAQADAAGNVRIKLALNWTMPLNFAEIISGDGNQVYRKRINLDNTLPFGNQTFTLTENMKNRKWLRVEVWDAAANGAFTQTVWLE
ncbi:MAG: hypothetical protein INR73_06475 [Williamsia sp.]|nr:hypothetical protein [Williamsia sp.]